MPDELRWLRDRKYVLSIPNYRIFKRDSPNLRESPPLSRCNSPCLMVLRHVRELASMSLRHLIRCKRTYKRWHWFERFYFLSFDSSFFPVKFLITIFPLFREQGIHRTIPNKPDVHFIGKQWIFLPKFLYFIAALSMESRIAFFRTSFFTCCTYSLETGHPSNFRDTDQAKRSKQSPNPGDTRGEGGRMPVISEIRRVI